MKQFETFLELAQTAQKIGEASDSKAKSNICAAYFKSINRDKDLNLAAQFLDEGAFPALSGKRISIGSRTYSTCAADFCEIDYEQVFKPSKKALGSASETIAKLINNIDAAREKQVAYKLSLRQVNQIFEHLYKASSVNEKKKILWNVWTKMTPVEIKYFLRILSRESLGIDLKKEDIITAISGAFEQTPVKVSRAQMIIQSIGQTAVLSKNNKLDKASFKIFTPLPYMLASSGNRTPLDNLNNYIAEEKLNGIRAQCHIRGSQIKILSRDLEVINDSFPEVLQFFIKRNLPDLVLDGQICVYKNNKILPLQILQKRMTHKTPDREIIKKYPALFIPFDLLYLNHSSFFNSPYIERRNKLEKLAEKYQLPISNLFEISDQQDLDKLYERAVAHGNEGIILKNKDSRYEYGQRGQSWLKYKKQLQTLHTVIMYAHTKNNGQSDHYSHYTLGIRVTNDERYEEEFIPIGKIPSGLLKGEKNRLKKQISELTVEKYGTTMGLIPNLVVEVEFDEVRSNRRTKANYILRMPKFKALRRDLGPDDVHSLKNVEQMYDEKVNRKRSKQGNNPSFHFKK